MKEKNLLKMADLIETIPQERFDMNSYRQSSTDNGHKCNSIGCIIGWSTQLDTKESLGRFRNLRWNINFEDWSVYFTGLESYSNEWAWCFQSRWKGVDNTPLGASKRIRYLVEVGLPEDWEKQSKGEIDLCYK